MRVCTGTTWHCIVPAEEALEVTHWMSMLPDDQQPDAGAIRPSWRPDYCVCGHVAGDHSDGRTAWPHEVAGGFCFVGGCDCKRYERDPAA